MSKASVLPEEMTLVGDVGGDEDFVVFGAVEGEVRVGGALTVERDGSVRGNVHGRTVAIRGTVVGDVSAIETVRVDDGGRMVGDVRAPRVNIVKGARFRGHVHMTGKEGARGDVAMQATFAPAGQADVPPRRGGVERHERKLRRERGAPPRDEVPTVAGTVRAVHERRTVSGAEAVLAAKRPPPPQLPRLRRTRARRKDAPAER